MKPPIHRQYTIDHALALAQETSHRHKIELTLSTVKETGEMITLLCHAHSQQQRIAFRGAGSGSLPVARIRAVMEALEDCFLHQSLNDLSHPAIHFYTSMNVPNHADLLTHEMIPSFLLADENQNNSFPWLELESINRSDSKIYYPIGLFFPHAEHIDAYNDAIPHQPLCQLANTTGLAMGASIAEATIHGINDWIERDAIGIFLLHTLITKKHPIKLIDKKSLPTDLSDEIQLIEEVNQDELYLVDITTNIDIPAFLVSFTKQPVPVQPSGLGASLCKLTALRHALHEALQARDRYNENTIIARNTTLAQFKHQPILLNAFKCDLINYPIQHIDWAYIHSINIPIKLDKQIDLINQHLNKQGLTAYRQRLFQDVNGLTLSYVLIPGLETFGTIREGNYSTIKKRGKAYLHEQSA